MSLPTSLTVGPRSLRFRSALLRLFLVGMLDMAVVRPVLGVDASQPPRLAGIVVGPSDRVAIFAARSGDQATVSVHQGEVIDGYLVQRIDPRAVSVLGPLGPETLETEAGDQPGASATAGPLPSSTSAQAPADAAVLQWETQTAGYSIARLAIQRDWCARSGALPGVKPDSEQRLQQTILAMSRIPARQGAEARLDPPAAALGSALAEGWDRARREGVNDLFSPTDCARTDMLWRQQAGGFGF